MARRDSDNRSNSSKRSARGVISNILSRSRSRQSSSEPEGDFEEQSGRRRSFTGGSRRMSTRLPGLNRKQSSSSTRNDSKVTGSTADAPPVPAVPSEHASNDSKGTSDEVPRTTNGLEKDTTIPVHPHSPMKAHNQKGQNGSNGASKGVLGGAVAAVAGAGAVAGATASGLASKVTGKGAEESIEAPESHNDDDDSDDDVFHDANLADIAEHDDEEEQSQSLAAHHHEDTSASKASSVKSHQHRHRGLSEGEGLMLGGATGPVYGNKGRESSERLTKQRSSSPKAPARLRGTAGAKRRSGSVPVGSENTPAESRAREETPFYVREKAARVRKLTYDDVIMDEHEMREDIEAARGALHLFLNSRMIEAEEIIAKYSDQKLYYALGDALIAVIKGIMTFEPEDLAKAISYCKDALHIASLLRKQSNTVASFGRFVRGTGHGTNTMASMNTVQRHAELIYAESTLLKSVMGILYSGDFFGFVSEALSMRNAYGIYRSLSKYVEWADDKAGGRDDSIDEDFRSGVYLGNGLISMILGLLPGKVLKIMEVFGYSGDTQWALKTLARAGAWSPTKSQPGMPKEQEGIRRQVCDMGILLYHLVISTFVPVTGVDIDFADKVLHYNLERYPEGVFFLYFSGRLYSTQSLAEKAIVQLKTARDVQREYVQLQHICVWDMSLCHMSLTQFDKAAECFQILLKDSNWSKCVYSYGEAANLWSSASSDNDPRRKEAAKIFHAVPDKMQRIAGKSIPMEKYCARKAKKFINQKRLLLPGIEFSYIYHCLTNAPAYSLSDNQLVEISEALQELNSVQDPSEYYSGADEYWDDYCLAHFLRGVTLRYIAYPEKHAKLVKSKSPIPANEASQQAEISLHNVIEASHRLSLDHYLCYFAHYELGRLHANRGDNEEARKEFDLIMSGKVLEAKGHKGSKYSMQNMCTLRSNGALSVL